MPDKLRIVIDIDDPETSLARIREFVIDVLSTWGGQLDPVDPLFTSLRVHRVKVERIPHVLVR